MKRLAYVLSAIALMATGAASLGCVWFVADEPKAIKSICD